MAGRHMRFTIHSSRAFEVKADSDGQLTISITAGENQLDLLMDEEVFAELGEMVDEELENVEEDPDGEAEL